MALSVSACTVPASPPAPDLPGEWRVISGTLSDGSALDITDGAPTVVFAKGVPTLFQPCTPSAIRSSGQADAELCLPETGTSLAAELPVSPTLSRHGKSLIVTGSDPDLRLELYEVDPISPASLSGAWVTTALSGSPQSSASFDFAADGTTSGVVGCKKFTDARVGQTNGVLTLSGVKLVGPECDPVASTPAADQLLAAIGSPFVFRLDPVGHLHIVPQGRGAPLEFVRAGNSVPNHLTGTSWELEYAHDVTGPIATSDDVWLYFRDDNISGTLICGSWIAPSNEQPTGPTAQNPLPITVKHISGIEGPCRNGQFKSRYLTALESVTAASQSDDALILSGDGVDLRFGRVVMGLAD